MSLWGLLAFILCFQEGLLDLEDLGLLALLAVAVSLVGLLCREDKELPVSSLVENLLNFFGGGTFMFAM